MLAHIQARERFGARHIHNGGAKNRCKPDTTASGNLRLLAAGKACDGSSQQALHLRIAHLREASIKLTDSLKIRRHVHANELIDQRPDCRGRIVGRHGDRANDFRR